MRVAILGVGLIGGSIGLAARRRAGAEVSGYDPDEGVLARAVELGALDRSSGDVADAVRGADVVFVAAPVGALTRTVTEALAGVGPDCVVSDVGSTKRVLAEASADERFIGGHPLAGAETAGVEHAREDLFEGAVWYLTPARACCMSACTAC
jgi:prephenate dehydrogenase